MSNIVFTCSFNRMCNSYYWCSTCAAREFFFLRKNLVRIIMSALTHTNNAHCEHGKKYCCHRLRYACVHFHFYHHYLGSHSYWHKVESDSKMLFFSLLFLFTLRNSHAVIYHLHRNHSQNLEIHARVIKCLLSSLFFLDTPMWWIVFITSFGINSIRFDSFQFNSIRIYLQIRHFVFHGIEQKL